MWHNHDRKEVDARENMAAIGMLGQLVDGLKNERVLLSADRRRLRAAVRGARHGEARAATTFEMQNCLIVTTTDDGLISRIDEYVDPTVGAQLA